jgi:hypothetical protein
MPLFVLSLVAASAIVCVKRHAIGTLSTHQAAKPEAWANALPPLGIGPPRCAMHCCGPKKFTIVSEKDAVFRTTEAVRLLQYCVEHWDEIAGRGVDDLEDLGRGRLLVARLAQLDFIVQCRDGGRVRRGRASADPNLKGGDASRHFETVPRISAEPSGCHAREQYRADKCPVDGEGPSREALEDTHNSADRDKGREAADAEADGEHQPAVRIEAGVT